MKPTIQIFAHRGASHLYPENTFPAFQEAIRLGATGLELDVQLSKDGHPVVIHDIYVDRTTDGKGLVKNYTLQELKELSAGSWFHPRFQKLKIPTLEEVFQRAVSLPIYLNIELKNLILQADQLEQEIIHLVRKYQLTNRVILSSFNPHSVEKIRELDPLVMTAFLYFGHLDSPWIMASDLHAQYIQPPLFALNDNLVQKCQEHGLLVYPYHVNKWVEIERAVRCCADGVITNFPERVRKFVE